MPKKLLVGLLLYSTFVFACEWDSDTLRDEAVANPSRFDVLVGQFAHHGIPYYQHRIEKLSAKASLTQTEKNDLAVAYTRVGEFEKSEKLLMELVKEDPDYYPALSNRGVLAKKQGDYETAIVYIGKALAINPEGHLGIGDWYLRMLEWLQKFEEDSNYDGHFLNYREDEGPSLNREEYMDRLFALVKNAQTFADGFYVLSRELANQNDFNLAFIAMVRARDLGHPKALAIEGEFTAENTGWMMDDELFGPPSDFSNAMGTESRLNESTVRETLEIASDWREKYARRELELLEQGIDPTFAAMKSETNIHDQKFRPAPFVKSSIIYILFGYGIVSLVVVVSGVIIVRKLTLKIFQR